MNIVLNETYMRLILEAERTNKLADNVSSKVKDLEKYGLFCEQTIQEIINEVK